MDAAGCRPVAGYAPGCGGAFDPAARGSEDDVIAFATLVGFRPAAQ